MSLHDSDDGNVLYPQETAQREWNRRVDDLAEASASARQILAELRSELREARHVLKELREEIANAVAVAVQTEIDEEVRTGLAKYADSITTAMDNAVDRVNGEFDKLLNTLMCGDGQGRGVDLRDLAKKAAEIDRRKNKGSNGID